MFTSSISSLAHKIGPRIVLFRQIRFSYQYFRPEKFRVFFDDLFGDKTFISPKQFEQQVDFFK